MAVQAAAAGGAPGLLGICVFLSITGSVNPKAHFLPDERQDLHITNRGSLGSHRSRLVFAYIHLWSPICIAGEFAV
jgi:hypothetical protein